MAIPRLTQNYKATRYYASYYVSYTEWRWTIQSIDDELWTRAQSRRETVLHTDASDEDRQLLPLVLSLARLAAHRDVRAGRLASGEAANV